MPKVSATAFLGHGNNDTGEGGTVRCNVITSRVPGYEIKKNKGRKQLI